MPDIRTFGALLICAVAACVTPGAAPLEGTLWRIVSYTDASGVAVAPVAPARIAFADGEIEGSPGCGSFVGEYRHDGATVVINAGAILTGGCLPPASWEQSAIVAEAISGSWRLDWQDERTIRLRGEGREVALVR